MPGRQPHAKGAGAFGVFETTEDVSAFTRAALFRKGAVTEMLARFSTVAGEAGSPDTWRDVRGFSLTFYTVGSGHALRAGEDLSLQPRSSSTLRPGSAGSPRAATPS